VSIEPDVAFSPFEALRLRQRRNDPIAFDGKTTKGDPVDGGKDFADKAFTWSEVIADPVEYQVRLTMFSTSLHRFIPFSFFSSYSDTVTPRAL
jgi:hypothetical protein